MDREEPNAVKEVLPILLSPIPSDVQNPSYWWALARAATHLSDLSPVVNIYLRHVPGRSEFLPAYFSSLGLFFHRLNWKDVLTLFDRLHEHQAFWHFFSDYLARRADRRAYEIILKNLDNPSLPPLSLAHRLIIRPSRRLPFPRASHRPLTLC